MQWHALPSWRTKSTFTDEKIRTFNEHNLKLSHLATTNCASYVPYIVHLLFLHLWTVLCRAVDLVGFFMDCAMGCHSKWNFFTVLLHTNKYQLKLQYFWGSMISRKIAATEKLGIKQSLILNAKHVAKVAKVHFSNFPNFPNFQISLELVHDLKDKHAFFLGIKLS